MTTSDVASLLPGDVILTRSKGLVGSLIRFGERVRYLGWGGALAWLATRILSIHRPDTPDDPWWVNHAAVSVGGGNLIEALAAGLTLSPASKYAGRPVVIVRVADLRRDLTDADRARLVLYARGQLARHDRYGWLSIASIILQLVTPLRLDISWDGALTCSAFAAYCLQHAGIVLPTLSPLTTMPADLASLRKPTPTIRINRLKEIAA